MFVIDESGSIRRVRRRPSNWDAKALRGWVILPENQPWDADQREAVILAIHQLAEVRDLVEWESDAWFKRKVAEYSRARKVSFTVEVRC